MAIFRESQSSDPRHNCFYDLPNVQWHGSVLYDKKTYTPLVGYNNPNIPALYSGTEEPTIGYSNYLLTAETKSIIPNNMGLAQVAYMNSNAYPYNYTPRHGEEALNPKAYFLDPEEPDVIYFIHIGPYFLSERLLVKYNNAEQKVIWAKYLTYNQRYEEKNGNNYTIVEKETISNAHNFRIWKISGDNIYVIGEVIEYSTYADEYEGYTLRNSIQVLNKYTGKRLSDVAYPNIQSDIAPNINDGNAEAVSFSCGDSLVPIDDNPDGTTVFFNSRFELWAIPKQVTNSSITFWEQEFHLRSGFTVYDPETNLFTSLSDKSIKNTEYCKNIRYFNGKYYKLFQLNWKWQEAKEYCEKLGGHLAIIESPEENEFLRGITEGNYCWIGCETGPTNEKFWIDGVAYSDRYYYNSDNSTSANNGMYFRSNGYIYAASKTDKYYFICEWDNVPAATVDRSNERVLDLEYYDGFKPSGELYAHIPKASRVDPTILNKRCVYSCWGYSFFAGAEDDPKFRQISRFEYDPVAKEQSMTNITTLNLNGTPMTYDDWLFDYPTEYPVSYDVKEFSQFSQPYLCIIGDKKYLAIFDFSFKNELDVETCDKLNRVHLFKFIGDTTVKLVDHIAITGTDVFWFREDMFIIMKPTAIRFIKIDPTTDKLVMQSDALIENSKNLFNFACIDDTGNFWYAESIYNEMAKSYNIVKMNYVNPYTIRHIQIRNSQTDFHWVGENIENYIDVGTISDLKELLPRKITLEITGNAKFAENNQKILEVATLKGAYKRVNFIITGPGEIVFNANLIKE